jgi:hypothetical protein
MCGHLASRGPDFRFGQKMDFGARQSHVRFTPESEISRRGMLGRFVP